MSLIRTMRGFTIVELLIVIIVLGILASIVINQVNGSLERARTNKAVTEMQLITKTIEVYRLENDNFYPADVNRNIPPPIIEYINETNGKEWPDAPWKGSVYDYDYYLKNDGSEVVQISIRFCPIGGQLSQCNFPKSDWAQGFTVNSSVYWCLRGACKAHPNSAAKGYCVNCATKITYN
jgi:general secretion pathway protein G